MYPEPASKFVEFPVQKLNVPLIDGVKLGATVTLTRSVPVHPLLSVTVTA